jgi:hypothetical protein
MARPSDHPAGCFWAGIRNCVHPIDAPRCVGVGRRIISPTDDVYLHRTFKCSISVEVLTANTDTYRDIPCESRSPAGSRRS